jgi:hypothetical protein
MNTVKRWLAGFLSFAMIFTSAAFTNVGAIVTFAADKTVAVVYDENGSTAGKNIRISILPLKRQRFIITLKAQVKLFSL